MWMCINNNKHSHNDSNEDHFVLYMTDTHSVNNVQQADRTNTNNSSYKRHQNIPTTTLANLDKKKCMLYIAHSYVCLSCPHTYSTVPWIRITSINVLQAHPSSSLHHFVSLVYYCQFSHLVYCRLPLFLVPFGS